MSFVRQRLYDLSRWPDRLIRDLPRRMARALAVFTPGRLPASWRLLGFFSALFDLAGGPELVQAVLRTVTRATPLTPAERAAVVSVLGPRAVRYDEVRVAQGGVLKWVFKINRQRAFCLWHTVCLPEMGSHRRGVLDLLVHEATHVFQYERLGSIYIGEALLAQRRWGRAAYDYGGPAGLQSAWRQGLPYGTFNREQQAQIAQHYFRRREKGDDLDPYHPYLAALRRGEF